MNEMREHSRGDIAEVEGRLAVFMRGKKADGWGRWEWMDGTWTAIPLSVGPVLLNVYDSALAASSDDEGATA